MSWPLFFFFGRQKAENCNLLIFKETKKIVRKNSSLKYILMLILVLVWYKFLGKAVVLTIFQGDDNVFTD